MKHELEQRVAGAVKELFGLEVGVELMRPDEQFGDYATNVALQLSKKLGKPPREVAETLAENIKTGGLALGITDVLVAGPGFLNIRLTDEAIYHAVTATVAQPLKGQVIVTEYSDPNPFKVLHAGHLYTTLVGDTISRILEAAGATVYRTNFGGDVGLHVARNMWAIVRKLGGEYPEKLEQVDKNPHTRAAWLSSRYVEGSTAYEKNDSAKAEIVAVNKRIYALHTENDHDSTFAQIYWTCRQWSYDYFDILYRELQVKPFDKYYPESMTTPLGVSTVQKQLARGVYTKSEGAVVFVGEPYGLHTRVFINSNGLPTYETKDVGLILEKWKDYHFDRSIVITGNDIVEYMKVVLKSIEQYEPELVRRTMHLPHGNLKLVGGKKMSSRKGDVLLAIDVLEAAREAAGATSNNHSEDTVLAAVKYAFAKQRIGGDIIFDPKESIALEGNSGPYLQYAHARARSILDKAGDSTPQDEQNSSETEMFTAEERSLARKLTEYPEVVGRATDELMPHHVCTYLYELAQQFNRFYENNRVIGDKRQRVRLFLVGQYADVLRTGLGLLGIAAPNHM